MASNDHQCSELHSIQYCAWWLIYQCCVPYSLMVNARARGSIYVLLIIQVKYQNAEKSRVLSLIKPLIGMTIQSLDVSEDVVLLKEVWKQFFPKIDQKTGRYSSWETSSSPTTSGTAEKRRKSNSLTPLTSKHVSLLLLALFLPPSVQDLKWSAHLPQVMGELWQESDGWYY